MPKSAIEIAEEAIARDDAGLTDGNEEEQKPKDESQTKDDNDNKSESAKDDKGSKDSGADKPKYDKDGKRIEEDKDSKATEESKNETDETPKDEEGKYTAEDALEVDTPDEPEVPTDNAGIQLSTAEQKYIASNIGEPLVIRGIVGEGDNAKEVEIKAYTVNDIPANFHFTSDQQRLAAQTGFAGLERKAEQLLGNFRQNQNVEAARDYERRENEGIRADIAELQQEGKFPKFRVQPGARGFDDTPEAKQISEVLEVMKEKNDVYLAQFNQGRPFKHIGFAEAYDLWEKSNPDKQAEAKADKDLKQEDAERGKVADRVGTNQGMTQSKIAKPTIRSGVTIDQILAAHEMDF